MIKVIHSGSLIYFASNNSCTSVPFALFGTTATTCGIMSQFANFPPCEIVWLVWKGKILLIWQTMLCCMCHHSTRMWILFTSNLRTCCWSCFQPSNTMATPLPYVDWKWPMIHFDLSLSHFSHHAICQPHQMILYERYPPAFLPLKSHLRSLNIDPRGLSRGTSHQERIEGRKTDHYWF